MNLEYTQQGDYLLPNLALPEEPRIGKYGRMRKHYLKEHHSGIYSGMLLNGTLNSHLEEIDQQATEMMERLVTAMAKQENVTEELKATDQMAWVGQMNNIRQRAEEVVKAELIYA